MARLATTGKVVVAITVWSHPLLCFLRSVHVFAFAAALVFPCLLLSLRSVASTDWNGYVLLRCVTVQWAATRAVPTRKPPAVLTAPTAALKATPVT